MTSEQTKEFLTIDELAERFHLTRGAIYHQRHRGTAPGSLGKKVGRRLLFRVSDIDTWWESDQEEDE